MTTEASITATRYTATHGVATITLNRLDNKNALSSELLDSLGDHLENAIADGAVRVIVLTNLGNTFCAGAVGSQGLAFRQVIRFTYIYGMPVAV